MILQVSPDLRWNRKFEHKLSVNDWTNIMMEQMIKGMAKGSIGKSAASAAVTENLAVAVTDAQTDIEVLN